MDSTVEHDYLLTHLEIGDPITLKTIMPPDGILFEADAIYEGTASNEEVNELYEEDAIKFIVYDLNRDPHHLIWIGNTLYVNDLLYMSFIDDMDDVKITGCQPIVEA